MNFKRFLGVGLIAILTGAVGMPLRPAPAQTLFDDFLFLSTPALYKDVVGRTARPGQVFMDAGTTDLEPATSVSAANLRSYVTSHAGVSAVLKRLFTAGLTLERGSIRFSGLQVSSATITTASSLGESNVTNDANVVVAALTVDSFSGSVCTTKAGGITVGANIPLKSIQVSPPGSPLPSASPNASPTSSPSTSPSSSSSPVVASPSPSESPKAMDTGTTTTAPTGTEIPQCSSSAPSAADVLTPKGDNSITVNFGATTSGRSDVTFSGGKLVIAVKVYHYHNDHNKVYKATFPDDSNNATTATESRFVEQCVPQCYGSGPHPDWSQFWVTVDSPNEDQISSFKLGTYCVVVDVQDRQAMTSGPNPVYPHVETIFCPLPTGQIVDSAMDSAYQPNRNYIKQTNRKSLAYTDGDRIIVTSLDINPTKLTYVSSEHILSALKGTFKLFFTEMHATRLNSLP